MVALDLYHNVNTDCSCIDLQRIQIDATLLQPPAQDISQYGAGKKFEKNLSSFTTVGLLQLCDIIDYTRYHQRLGEEIRLIRGFQT